MQTFLILSLLSVTTFRADTNDYSLKFYIRSDDCETCLYYTIEKLAKVDSTLRTYITVSVYTNENHYTNLDLSELKKHYNIQEISESELNTLYEQVGVESASSFILVYEKGTLSDYIPIRTSYLKNVDFILNFLKLNTIQ